MFGTRLLLLSHKLVLQGTVQEGEVIAVKRLDESSPVPRDKVFYNEAVNIMALNHDNIVKLVGYCHETVKQVVRHNGRYVIADIVECLLCYEYLPIGNVHKNLFGIHTQSNIFCISV